MGSQDGEPPRILRSRGEAVILITEQVWDRIIRRLTALGFMPADMTWSEGCQPPETADFFAREIIFVICNSGMKNTVARGIYNRVEAAIRRNDSSRTVFGHDGKCRAIDRIWIERDSLFDAYRTLNDDDAKVEFLGRLPWIGNITKFHAAKNFGVDCVKPDVHLQRLADHEGITPTAMCKRLGYAAGLKLRTVDLILWRACAEGVINSKTGEIRA